MYLRHSDFIQILIILLLVLVTIYEKVPAYYYITLVRRLRLP
jgi:hypothetical protein